MSKLRIGLIIGVVSLWGVLQFIPPPGVRLPVPADSPKQPLSSPSQAYRSPIPRPERKPETPTSTSLTFYVVSENVPREWGLVNVLAGWKSAKFSSFKQASGCPVAAPCITIYMYKFADKRVAGQANFTDDYSGLNIKLNPSVKNTREMQSTLSHEFGHLLGAPHIAGTNNTVMNAVDVYRTLPTALDIQTVDRLGNWELEKMYENSGKTVDVRTAPK